jgi:hypothetical protein
MVDEATVACLKWGQKYPAEWVNRLARGVDRHLAEPHRVVCFTDDVAGVECDTEPLPDNGVHGWWNKLWLFSLERELLFFDLDCVIVGDIAPLFHVERFTICKDPWAPGYNSSVMKITPGLGFVWQQFMRARPDLSHRLNGDQDFLNLTLLDAALFDPAWCLSYKAHVRGKALPDSASVVYFHGEPKMNGVGDAWVRENWS